MKRFAAVLTILAMLVWLPVSASAQERKPIHALIITGDYQGDWRALTEGIKEVLTDNKIDVTVTDKPSRDLTAANLARFDVFILSYRDTPKGPAESRWSEDNKRALAAAVNGGKGLVVLGQSGAAFSSGQPSDGEYAKLVAGGCRKSAGRSQGNLLRVSVTGGDHPVLKDVPRSFRLEGDEVGFEPVIPNNAVVLAEVAVLGKKNARLVDRQQPVLWTTTYGKGKVYHLELGGARGVTEEAGFKTLLVRGVEWAATGKVFFKVPEALRLQNAG